jgi:hypothetical protein
VKGWRQKYQDLFIVLISFGILIFPTYGLFYSLEKMDVFRSPHWENPIQEDLLAVVDKKWAGSEWNFSAIIFPPKNESLKLFSALSLNPLSIEKVLVLRC